MSWRGTIESEGTELGVSSLGKIPEERIPRTPKLDGLVDFKTYDQFGNRSFIDYVKGKERLSLFALKMTSFLRLEDVD